MATWQMYVEKFGAWFIVLIIWTLLWKGYALWTSAKNNQKGWFVALLVINTVGILEIIYIFCVAKKKFDEVKRDFLGIFSSNKEGSQS